MLMGGDDGTKDDYLRAEREDENQTQRSTREKCKASRQEANIFPVWGEQVKHGKSI